MSDENNNNNNNNLLSPEDLKIMEQELVNVKESLQKPVIDIDKLKEDTRKAVLEELSKEREEQATRLEAEAEAKAKASEEAINKVKELEAQLASMGASRSPATTPNPFNGDKKIKVDEMTSEDIRRIDEASEKLFFSRGV
jgi:beta-phosphoglucomutase-like phosphatase (HAD superfamily)